MPFRVRIALVSAPTTDVAAVLRGGLRPAAAGERPTELRVAELRPEPAGRVDVTGFVAEET